MEIKKEILNYYKNIHNEILNYCIYKKDEDVDIFSKKSKKIENYIKDFNIDKLLQHLNFAGIIPEEFAHDSTEEKLYAKYCDVLVAKSLEILGFETKVMVERQGEADVLATSNEYKIVLDAKAFRLSRTAKNQKDFKVDTLNTWKINKEADFACLISPLYQYPSSKSQIYYQAIEGNVTLLSYTHLSFLIRNRYSIDTNLLKKIWETGISIKHNLQSKVSTNFDAQSYWKEIRDTILNITKKSEDDWKEYKINDYILLQHAASYQREYWEKKKRKIESMSDIEAKEELIKINKIPQKIKTINKLKNVKVDPY